MLSWSIVSGRIISDAVTHRLPAMVTGMWQEWWLTRTDSLKHPTAGKEVTWVKICFLKIKCRYQEALARDLEVLLWQAGLCYVQRGLCLWGAGRNQAIWLHRFPSWSWKAQSISRDPKCTGQQKQLAAWDSVRMMPTFCQEILKANLENLGQLGCCFLRSPLFWVSYHPPHRVTHLPIKAGSTVTESKHWQHLQQ